MPQIERIDQAAIAELNRHVANLEAFAASATRHDSTLRKDVMALVLDRELHASEIVCGCDPAEREVNAAEFRKLLANALLAPSTVNHELLGRHVVDMAIETLRGEF